LIKRELDERERRKKEKTSESEIERQEGGIDTAFFLRGS